MITGYSSEKSIRTTVIVEHDYFYSNERANHEAVKWNVINLESLIMNYWKLLNIGNEFQRKSINNT